MKTILVLAIIAISSVFAIDIGCYPSAVQSSSNQLYVSYNKNAYKYSLPDLNLKASKSYNQYVCGPATMSGNNVKFAASQSNSNSTLVSGNDLSIVSQSNSAAPYPPAFSNMCVTVSGVNYCFDYSNNVASIKKKNGNTVVESLTLPIADNGNYFITGDSAVAGRIHVATHSCQYRGCTQLQYYALAVNPLRIVRGPVALPHTVFSGCPVEPKSCAVDVLLSGTVSVQDDIVSYAWSISDNGDFKVSLVSYDARCNKFKNVRLGESLAVEARCSGTPATTNAPTRNCWTCPAGYVHWYDIQGFPEPSDKCACVPRPVSTTKAPAHNCWTCPAGYVHWYDIQGYPEPADKCACVRPATSAPVTTTKAPSATTKAPAHNCWTCPAGFVHWYDINGMPEPADKCACVRPATGAPVTTKAPARNCWTCPAGFVHWYDIQGYPEPADKCACVRPATSAPTRNCWTCPAGYVHWYDIPNAQEPADKCACVRRSRDLNTLVQSSN